MLKRCTTRHFDSYKIPNATLTAVQNSLLLPNELLLLQLLQEVYCEPYL